MGFTNSFQLKGLKPKNKDQRTFMNVVIWQNKYISCTYIELGENWNKKYYYYYLFLFYRFEIAIFILIFLNMVSMGIEHYNQSRVVTFTLEICNALFTTIFSLGEICITFIYYLEKGKSNHFYFFSISTLVLLIYKSSLGGFIHIFLLGNRACLRSSAEFWLSMEWY